jgi:hypothetical protein
LGTGLRPFNFEAKYLLLLEPEPLENQPWKHCIVNGYHTRKLYRLNDPSSLFQYMRDFLCRSTTTGFSALNLEQSLWKLKESESIASNVQSEDGRKFDELPSETERFQKPSLVDLHLDARTQFRPSSLPSIQKLHSTAQMILPELLRKWIPDKCCLSVMRTVAQNRHLEGSSKATSTW